MTQIVNTGERILLEAESPLMIARHMCAYRFAQPYCTGKDILDIGCGEGYGVNYLASYAKSALGVDYSVEAMRYACSKYLKGNLTFKVCLAEELSTLACQFDVICSFQVIEHIVSVQQFLRQVKALLKEQGIFICSTPNRLDASPASSTPLNKFHVREYLLNEFKELLHTCFSDVEIVGLKRGGRLNFFRRLKKIGICNALPLSCNPVRHFYERVNCDHFKIAKTKLEAALDFIAVCSG